MFVCYSMQIVYGILLLLNMCNVKGKPITALRRDQTWTNVLFSTDRTFDLLLKKTGCKFNEVKASFIRWTRTAFAAKTLCTNLMIKTFFFLLWIFVEENF